MKLQCHAHSTSGKRRREGTHWEIEWEADWKSKSSWVVPSVVFGLVEWLTRASCKCEVQRASGNSKCLLSLATHVHVRLLSYIRIFDSHPQKCLFYQQCLRLLNFFRLKIIKMIDSLWNRYWTTLAWLTRTVKMFCQLTQKYTSCGTFLSKKNTLGYTNKNHF